MHSRFTVAGYGRVHSYRRRAASRNSTRSCTSPPSVSSSGDDSANFAAACCKNWQRLADKQLSASPTTRFRDYASSPELFHWETQAAASVTRPSGRRYIESATTGWSFFLFVRPDPDSSFAFLGPVTYESHTGDRPIAITWRLATPMPAVLYDRYATLRPG